MTYKCIYHINVYIIMCCVLNCMSKIFCFLILSLPHRLSPLKYLSCVTLHAGRPLPQALLPLKYLSCHSPHWLIPASSTFTSKIYVLSISALVDPASNTFISKISDLSLFALVDPCLKDFYL